MGRDKPRLLFAACPFCASGDGFSVEDNADPKSTTYWVRCGKTGCECDGPWRKSPEDAVGAWNARASASPEA